MLEQLLFKSIFDGDFEGIIINVYNNGSIFAIEYLINDNDFRTASGFSKRDMERLISGRRVFNLQLMHSQGGKNGECSV